MPTSTHQAVLAFLYDLFNTYLKPRGYAEARIPEYWIVDPRDEVITVPTPRGDAYVESGVYEGRSTATSPLLDSFYADVSAVFDAPKSTTQTIFSASKWTRALAAGSGPSGNTCR